MNRATGPTVTQISFRRRMLIKLTLTGVRRLPNATPVGLCSGIGQSLHFYTQIARDLSPRHRVSPNIGSNQSNSDKPTTRPGRLSPTERRIVFVRQTSVLSQTPTAVISHHVRSTLYKAAYFSP
jgi:hypothetical protein